MDEATGYITSSFGKTGKFTVTFRGGQTSTAKAGDKLALRFRTYLVGTVPGKKFVQI
jgi:hypothetical protein